MGVIDRMNFRALDSDFNATEIIDGHDSMIWTDYYNDVGDFELQGANNDDFRSLVNESTYIFNSVTSGLMVIEKPAAKYTEEDGDTITITGRSMSSVLDRRVIPSSKTIVFPTDTGDRRISTIVCGLVADAFGPALLPGEVTPHRYWSKPDGSPRLQVVDATTSTDESVKLSVGVNLQLTLGDSLLKVVTDLCVAVGIGFKFTFSVIDKTVTFTVYEGIDHSILGQGLIIFSDLYDNLLTASETVSIAAIKNAMLVVGSAVDPVTQLPRLPQFIGDDTLTGIDRRETYFQSNQQDIVYKADGTQCPMTSDDYIAAVRLAGKNELAKADYQVYSEYAGEILEVRGYQYGVNFILGDIIAFLLPHHLQTVPARIDGITFSDDAALGKTLAPSFNYLYSPVGGGAVGSTGSTGSTGATGSGTAKVPDTRPTITITTFGYDYGAAPSGQKFVMDLTRGAHIINTGNKTGWTLYQTGLDPAISRAVLKRSDATADLAYMVKHWLPNLKDGNKIAVGCSRGHHRSVALTQGPSPAGKCLSSVLKAHGYNVKIINRDINRHK